MTRLVRCIHCGINMPATGDASVCHSCQELLADLADEPDRAPEPARFAPRPRWPFPRPSRHFEPDLGDRLWLAQQPDVSADTPPRRGRWGR